MMWGDWFQWEMALMRLYKNTKKSTRAKGFYDIWSKNLYHEIN